MGLAIKSSFNPAAVYEDGRVHLIYRALSSDGISVFGYAVSKDGFHIDENLTIQFMFHGRNLKKEKNRSWRSAVKIPGLPDLRINFI